MPDEEAIEVESEVLRDETPAEETEEPSQETVESEEAEAEDSTEAKEATEEPGDDDTAEPKKKDRVQKRIDRLTADKRAAERRVQELERRMLDNSLPVKPQETPTPLKEADFENYEDYLVAKATQEAERKVTAKFQEQQQRQQADQQRSRQADMASTFQAKADDAREKHDDFDDVAFNRDTPVTDHMMQAILESDAGPDIAYHLGSNPREAQRISSLPPLSQARELGKIEAALTAEVPKKQTTAPDPPNKLKGKARPTRDPGKMSQTEYEAFRSKSK